MRIHKSRFITLLSILVLVLPLFAGVEAGYAQESNGWSEPVNLSTSGLAADPLLMWDTKGTLHAFWTDEEDGYKYSQSADDGVTWSAPKAAHLPFDPESTPVLFSDAKGLIHILWLNEAGTLFYGETTTLGLLDSETWLISRMLGTDVVRFRVTLDSLGVMHLVYVQNANHENRPAGIYYRRSAVGGGGWTDPVTLFTSEYFRSSTESETFVGIASSNTNSPMNVYVTWDNQPQKRVYMAVSQDGGVTWGEAQEMIGPKATGGVDSPFNLNVAAAGSKVLMLWQSGEPGAEKCTIFSRSSEDSGQTWGETVSVLGGPSECPKSTGFLVQQEDQTVAQINPQGDPILTAWDGKKWSDPQAENHLPTIINPVTLEPVSLGCRFDLFRNGRLYVAGCDEGGGGDVWFLSRTLAPIDQWFSLPSTWEAPLGLSDELTDASPVSLVADAGGMVRAIWAQSVKDESGVTSHSLEYAGWDGDGWTKALSILNSAETMPLQISLAVHPQQRLLLTWVDESGGDLLFSWVNLDKASQSTEWASPVVLPSTSDLISSPDMVVDGSGRIAVAYAISLNEGRGIYVVESTDGGNVWSMPVTVFDGVAALWGKLGDPRISMGVDGILHLIFSRQDLRPGQPVGLYYTRSRDGGATWSEAQLLSEGAIQWSDLVSYDQHTVQAFWQEYDGLVYANMTQFSIDGGQTWSKPQEITGSNAQSSPVAVALDPAGRICFVQLLKNENESTVTQDNLVVQDWQWNGTEWAFGSDRDLTIQGKGSHYSLAAAINSQGYLMASISAAVTNPQNETSYQVQTVHRFLGTPGEVQQSPAAILPTPNVVSANTEVPTVLPTESVNLSELQNDNVSSISAQRTTIGLVIIGLVMVVTAFLLFRGRSTSPIEK